ncbi:PEP/pyruvate-binding domain-containing protein, partial [Brachybacterium sp.]|uniref:PEP/pyruvate-binding domain-containing protein n=1 Tax=Brachybacterium sp. TaxID=1891286 RepID=UPI002ED096E7
LARALRPRAQGALGPQVAVRSSATHEDTAGASAAGQHKSILAVRGSESVAAAVLQCWASLWSHHAVCYRQARPPRDAAPPEMAVIVQRFIEADVSGVLFTGEESTVEAVRGRGEQLVGGAVTPDAWRVGAARNLERRLGDRAQRAPCLSDAQVHALVTLGEEVVTVLGTEADVEWALLDQRLHVLQARPITVAVPRTPKAGPRDAGALRGTPASGGVARGTARCVRGPQDFRRVQPGEVLVCHATDPAWTPLFTVAGAVVTETGGVLSHAAIVARELGIPAVLAVPSALAEIPDGALVTVDGDAGLVKVAATPV